MSLSIQKEGCARGLRFDLRLLASSAATGFSPQFPAPDATMPVPSSDHFQNNSPKMMFTARRAQAYSGWPSLPSLRRLDSSDRC
jgi:hypothetical protein